VTGKVSKIPKRLDEKAVRKEQARSIRGQWGKGFTLVSAKHDVQRGWRSVDACLFLHEHVMRLTLVRARTVEAEVTLVRPTSVEAEVTLPSWPCIPRCNSNFQVGRWGIRGGCVSAALQMGLKHGGAGLLGLDWRGPTICRRS
jgi:hypothetical protein